jgi:hypothetical protein
MEPLAVLFLEGVVICMLVITNHETKMTLFSSFSLIAVLAVSAIIGLLVINRGLGQEEVFKVGFVINLIYLFVFTIGCFMHSLGKKG